LVWQTPAIRYATYAVGGIILVSVFGWFAGLLAPPPPAGARAEATTADFHVVCTNPSCGIHFAVRRPFGFDDFPVRCPKCKQETGFPARRCVSKTCNGKWVVPEKVDGVLRCPICGTPFR